MRGLVKTCVLLLFVISRVDAFANDSPNVLFIAVDDLRDWVGHLSGHPQALTPNIDRLAKQGISFSNAYCSAPLCNPSRISLLTGIAPYRSGVYGNREKLRDKLPTAVTLMQHFRSSGYSVRGAGKIFHGTSAYDQDSWDEYFRPIGLSRLPRIDRSNELPKTAWAPWGPVEADDHELFDGANANWVISQLRKSHQKPFFLAYGLTKPHLPWEVPQKYFDLHPLSEILLPKIQDDDLGDVPSFGQKLAREVYDPSGERDFSTPGGDHQNILRHQQWRKAVQAYLATISFADAQIGRVLKALEKSEHADTTLVVLWGDHGWHLGEKEHWRKHALWSVSSRTPLILSMPRDDSDYSRGEVCTRTVSLIDLYPTLIDLCNLNPRKELEGRSLMPLLRDPSGDWPYPALTTHGFNNHAIQQAGWRYIRYGDGGEELYNHDLDPNEWINLASVPEHKDTIRRLRSHLPVINRR